MTTLSDLLEGQTKEIIKRLSSNTRNWLEYIAAKNETFLFDIVYERLQYFRYMSENERNVQLQKEQQQRTEKENRIRQWTILDSTNE